MTGFWVVNVGLGTTGLFGALELLMKHIETPKHPEKLFQVQPCDCKATCTAERMNLSPEREELTVVRTDPS